MKRILLTMAGAAAVTVAMAAPASASPTITLPTVEATAFLLPAGSAIGQIFAYVWIPFPS
jgi:hypothetical protein